MENQQECNVERYDFRIDLFNEEIQRTLSFCQMLGIPVNISGVGDEINYLLTKCFKIFYIPRSISTDDVKQSFEIAKIVLDITWEKLNTGYWKDINVNWRDVFTFASLCKVMCLLFLKHKDIQEIIKICDMGLLMGAPLMDNILSKVAFKLNSMVPAIEFQEPEPTAKRTKVAEIENTIPEGGPFSQQYFNDNYVKKSIPVILKGAVNDWPAMSSNPWSIEYILKKTAYRTVPIEIGSKYTDDSWTQKLMTMEHFIKAYMCDNSVKKEIGYLAQHNFFDQIPQLFDDIKIPAYIDDNCLVETNVWFGPAGTISPLHYDAKYNLLAQVLGEKYIRLYNASEAANLYPRRNTWLSNTSQVDVENPDLEAFPLFAKASHQECVLKPGNVLFIPPGCWHYVRSLSNSLSISFWWKTEDG